MGNLLRTELAVLGTLITLLIPKKDMIPYRHSQIYGDMNKLLLCIVAIIIITFVVSLFERHLNEEIRQSSAYAAKQARNQKINGRLVFAAFFRILFLW